MNTFMWDFENCLCIQGFVLKLIGTVTLCIHTVITNNIPVSIWGYTLQNLCVAVALH